MTLKDLDLVKDMKLQAFVAILKEKMVKQVACPYYFKSGYSNQLSCIETGREVPSGII